MCCELALDALAQLLEALPVTPLTSTASGWRRRSSSRASLVEQVDLVEHQQPRALAGADLLERLLDRALHDRSPAASGAEASSTCSEQIGAARLLERGAERVDQLVGQLADEADGVGQQVGAARPARSVRVVGSSVWNRRSRTPTSAPVSAFSSVDLPALV